MDGARFGLNSRQPRIDAGSFCREGFSCSFDSEILLIWTVRYAELCDMKGASRGK